MPKRRVKNMNRDQQKAVFYHLNHPPPPSNYQVRRKMNQRSKHAQKIDRAKQAKNSYDIRNKEGKTRWWDHPNQYDIKNIDSKIAKERYRAKVSKRKLKEKKIKVRKIRKQIHKKREQLVKAKTPQQKKEIKREIKKKEIDHKKAELDVKDVEVGHRKVKRSIHEKQTEKQEVMYIMKTTQNNNYIESKSLLERVKNKGLAYDNVDWDAIQGPDLTYNDRVRRLDSQVGKTQTDEEFYHGHEEEKYNQQYEDWLESQGRD